MEWEVAWVSKPASDMLNRLMDRRVTEAGGSNPLDTCTRFLPKSAITDFLVMSSSWS